MDPAGTRPRTWSAGEDELLGAIERLGCEGALLLCYQMESEHDCYRLFEERCGDGDWGSGSKRLRAGSGAGEGESDTVDCEPGPDP